VPIYNLQMWIDLYNAFALAFIDELWGCGI